MFGGTYISYIDNPDTAPESLWLLEIIAMKPRLFLTGSTSYLGTKFIELYGNDYEIFGISRSDPQHSIDLQDKAAVRDAFILFKPNFVVHLAADLGRDATTSDEITKTNPAITEFLVELALENNASFIFTSTEAVYGGKTDGGYVETDDYQPRNPYGASKVASEKIVIESGLPYLITRGHRYVGINRHFDKPKQFPETLNALISGEKVHLDSQKIFTPMFLNYGCDILNHYILRDHDKQVILNVGIDKPITYFDFVVDVARTLGLNDQLVKSDGEEAGWPANSSLSMLKLHDVGYPIMDYRTMLEIMRSEFNSN